MCQYFTHFRGDNVFTQPLFTYINLHQYTSICLSIKAITTRCGTKWISAHTRPSWTDSATPPARAGAGEAITRHVSQDRGAV